MITKIWRFNFRVTLKRELKRNRENSTLNGFVLICPKNSLQTQKQLIRFWLSRLHRSFAFQKPSSDPIDSIVLSPKRVDFQVFQSQKVRRIRLIDLKIFFFSLQAYCLLGSLKVTSTWRAKPDRALLASTDERHQARRADASDCAS